MRKRKSATQLHSKDLRGTSWNYRRAHFPLPVAKWTVVVVWLAAASGVAPVWSAIARDRGANRVVGVQEFCFGRFWDDNANGLQIFTFNEASLHFRLNYVFKRRRCEIASFLPR